MAEKEGRASAPLALASTGGAVGSRAGRASAAAWVVRSRASAVPSKGWLRMRLALRLSRRVNQAHGEPPNLFGGRF
jgi:hypothetical protein